MYAKIEDGMFIIAPGKLPGDGVIVYNPPAEMYLASGYKPVTYTDPPEDPPEGYTYENSWEEQENAIVQVWTLVKLPDDVDEFELVDILFGGLE